MSTGVTPAGQAALDELIALAQEFGRDAEFSRGGGGNASAKVGDALYIKPSGVPLATLTVDALVPLAIEPLLALLADRERVRDGAADPVMEVAGEARLAEAGGRRPSVELLFHALIPERFVLHTHPVLLNAITCASDGEAIAARCFGDRALWIPYTDPGLPLARAIADARAAYASRTGTAAPAIMLLQNHGAIVASDSTAEIARLSRWLLATTSEEVERHPAPTATVTPTLAPERARALVDEIGPALRALLTDRMPLRIVTFEDQPLAATFASTQAGRAFLAGGPLAPDQIVYIGSWPLVLDIPDDAPPADVPPLLRAALDAHEAAHGELPIVTIVPGLGFFAAGDTWAEADTARHVQLDTLRIGETALRLGGARPLAEAERTFIERWEAEAYRRGRRSGAGPVRRQGGGRDRRRPGFWPRDRRGHRGRRRPRDPCGPQRRPR